MQVQTVLGKVSADALGITLPHEHLLIDLRCLTETTTNPQRSVLKNAKVAPWLRGILHSDPYQCADNLLLDDWRLAADEAMRFHGLGGRTIVDLTTRTIGPFPQELEQIARTTNLNIVAGTGFYIGKAHPDWVFDSSDARLSDFMTSEILEGIDGTGIKAGIIGELGTSSPMLPAEERVLSAAARTQKETGVAINVHLSIFKREGDNVLSHLEKEGVNLDRVVLSHVDESLDFEYIKGLALRGAYVELDTFGSEFAFDEREQREPSDFERVELLLRLLDAGLGERLLISQDACCKIHLVHYGGFGYGHILRTIVPRLKKKGVDDATIEQLLVTNPARMLSGSNP